MKASPSDESHSAVTDVCAAGDGSLVAVAIQRQVSEIFLFFLFVLTMYLTLFFIKIDFPVLVMHL